MPNVPAFEVNLGNVATAAIEYNDANNRVSNVRWEITSQGVACRVLIYDTRQSEEVPIYDRTFAFGSGIESVPGNHTMQVIDDPDIGTILRLPDYLRYEVLVRTL